MGPHEFIVHWYWLSRGVRRQSIGNAICKAHLLRIFDWGPEGESVRC